MSFHSPKNFQVLLILLTFCFRTGMINWCQNLMSSNLACKCISYRLNCNPLSPVFTITYPVFSLSLTGKASKFYISIGSGKLNLFLFMHVNFHCNLHLVYWSIYLRLCTKTNLRCPASKLILSNNFSPCRPRCYLHKQTSI